MIDLKKHSVGELPALPKKIELDLTGCEPRTIDIPLPPAASSPNTVPGGMKNCPFCAETIKDEAIKCRFCGEFLKSSKDDENVAGEMLQLKDDTACDEKNDTSNTQNQTPTEKEINKSKPDIQKKNTYDESDVRAETLINMIIQHSKKIYDNHVFINEIPNKKGINAINAYASNLSTDDIMILVDDTLFGSAKEGMIITIDEVYAHEIFSTPKRICIEDIESIYVKWGKLEINDKDFFDFTQVSEPSMQVIAEMLRAWVKILTGKAPAGNPARGILGQLGHEFMKGYKGNK